MITSRITRPLLASAALAVLTLPAQAQDASAIADRLVSLIMGEGAAEATYATAAMEGDSVTIAGLEVVTRADEGSDTFTAETTVLTSPELTDAEGLRAASISMLNGRVVSTNWGEATVESVSGMDFDLAAKGEANAEGGTTDNAPSAVASGTLTGVTVDPTQSEPFTIASIDFEQGDYVDSVATRRSFSFEDVILSRGDFGADSDEVFDTFGVDEITADISGAGRWDAQAGTLTISEARISADDLGSIAMTLDLNGVSEGTFALLESSPMQALSPLALAGMTLDIETGALVDDAVEMRAEALGVTVDDLRTSAIVTSKQMLFALSDSPFKTALEAAIENFASGEASSLSISATPQTAVPILAVGLTAQTAPDALPGLLNLDVATD